MNAYAAARRENRALVRSWRRSVFCDRELCGFVHHVEAGWLSERRYGGVIGTYPTERLAVVAVLDAQRHGA